MKPVGTTTVERARFSKLIKMIAIAGALLALVAPATASAGGCGVVVTEQLTGLGGFTNRGRAIADESQILCGGTTSLFVEVTDLDLPDGTVLDVSIDFRPIGSIILSGMRGALSADLGRFAVSNDSVRVSFQGTVLAIGSFFR